MLTCRPVNVRHQAQQWEFKQKRRTVRTVSQVINGAELKW